MSIDADANRGDGEMCNKQVVAQCMLSLLLSKILVFSRILCNKQVVVQCMLSLLLSKILVFSRIFIEYFSNK